MHDPSATDTPHVEEYLTPDEVATRLKVSKRTILRWIETGELPSIKIGGTVRIPSAKLRDSLSGKETA